jgi:2-(1,2-epoxy-1,2-dihydrophenyl)acetyl-CoA isomerase
MYEHILFSVADGVCRITLNRPQVHNALNAGLIREVTTAIEAAGADASVRVVLLTGAGDRAFCAGADLKEGFASLASADGPPSMGASLRAGYNPMILAMRNLPKPIVGRINGVAAGAGASLALACDALVCHEEAYFSQIFINIGLMPDAGSTFFLPRLVGSLLAFDLAATGRRVYGPEAARIGLVNRSVQAGELDTAVAELVDYYATAPTLAIGRMKLALNSAYQNTLTDQLEIEADGQDALGRSADAAEGIGSFLMKRAAKFSGR